MAIHLHTLINATDSALDHKDVRLKWSSQDRPQGQWLQCYDLTLYKDGSSKFEFTLGINGIAITENDRFAVENFVLDELTRHGYPIRSCALQNAQVLDKHLCAFRTIALFFISQS